MDKLYQFDDCRPSLKQFGGSDKKESVFFNDKRYMLKYDSEISDEDRTELASSSRNNVYSEYVACHIYETVGIPVQNTLLGERHGHIVVACEDFCVNGYNLNEFEKNSSAVGVRFRDVRFPPIEDVIAFIRQDSRMDSVAAERRFWDIFVMDALLGNFDRHTGNWGYLYNDEIQETILAPVYDCASCLYPQLSDEGMMHVMRSQEEIDKRIYVYPKAAFTYGGQKISYDSFLQSPDILNEYQLLSEALKDIRERAQRDKINSVIENTPTLSEIRRVFYQTMIRERMEKIIAHSCAPRVCMIYEDKNVVDEPSYKGSSR